MNILIRQVLNKIEEKDFEAYIIGGYVRDYLLGKKSFDIDICTSATIDDLMTIFPNAKFNNIGGITFTLKKYNFEITTYREELTYKNRKPIKINFVDDILIDLKRRDFTINALTMDKKGQINDYLNSLIDLENKEIKMIGDINTKITEDPLRILRAIRFAVTLDFNLEPKLYEYIKNNISLVSTLSDTRIKEELDKILLSSNITKYLNLLEDLGLIKLLEITFDKIIPVKSIIGMYAQLNIKYNLPFTKEETKNINNLKNILNEEPLTSYTIYNYGLDLSLIASSILKIDSKIVIKMSKNLPIKSIKDIKITSKEIKDILNIDNKEIGKIYQDLENLIISGKIKNTNKSIRKYLMESR